MIHLVLVVSGDLQHVGFVILVCLVVQHGYSGCIWTRHAFLAHMRITAVRAHIGPNHCESIASNESHLAYRASHELLRLDTPPGTSSYTVTVLHVWLRICDSKTVRHHTMYVLRAGFQSTHRQPHGRDRGLVTGLALVDLPL